MNEQRTVPVQHHVGSNLATEFDLARRLSLMKRMGWFLFVMYFLGLGALDLVYIVSNVNVGLSVILATAVLQVTLPLVAIGCIILARKQRATLALIALIICLLAPVLIIHIIYISRQVFDVQLITLFASYSFIIIIPGILGGPRSIIGATLALFILEIGIASLIPDHAMDSHARLITVMNSLTQQLGIMVTMLLANASYVTTLRALGASQAQVERARQLDELKDQFISSVNHELRTPVMAMLANIEGLYLTADRATPERRKQLIDRAYVSGNNLRQLLDSILDIRRVDQGARNFVPELVYVAEVVQSAINAALPGEAVHLARNVRVAIPSSIAIWGDRIRLQQVLTNLLTNAIKYSDEGTPIEIQARMAYTTEPTRNRWGWQSQKQHPLIEISVRDWGLGVPPEQIPLLFQRFVRLPRDLASTRVGNGLGLYLCRELITAMDGTIHVESTGIPHEGSTFIMHFPLPPLQDEMPITDKHRALR